MLRLTLRNLLARKVRLVMSTLAIVLGVAFLSGVLTFSNGMQSTFDNIISGSTPDAVVRPVGTKSFDDGTAGVSKSTLSPGDIAALRALPEVEQANGSVDGFGMSLLDRHKKLVGGQGAPTISFNYTDTDNILGKPTLDLERGSWPAGTDQVVLDKESAKRAGYHVGDQVSLISPYGDLLRRPTMVGTANFNGGGTAGATLLIFSTKGAQDIFLGGQDVFTSVSLNAKPGVSQRELVAAADKVLPSNYTAVRGDTIIKESQSAVGEFLGIIKTVLLVFALIAVVVGAFIIINTFSILIAQRVRELALLRALGASRRQVTRSVLFEALVMSLIASVLGIITGWALALGLAGLFSSIGLKIGTSALDLTPGTIVTCLVVGVVVTMLSAYMPARRAAKVPPVAAMREDAFAKPRSLHRRTILGSIFLVIGAACAVLGVTGAPGNNAVWIGIGAFIWIITVAAISPVIGKPVLFVCRSIFGRLFGPAGRLAGENALRDPRRTGATASALMIGLALVSTIAVLASSMNRSVDDLVDENFSSDFLIQSQNFLAFPAAIGNELAKVDGVGVLSRQQMVSGTVDGQNADITANDPAFDKIYELDMVHGRQAVTGHEALISTDAAKKYGARVGSDLKLGFTAGRPQTVRVAGIFKSGTPVTGNVSVPFGVLDDAGIQHQDTTISVNVADGADKAAVHKALDKVIARVPIVSVQDRDEFAQGIRGQIDQLLYMIYGLLALAILIAVIGIINTLGLSVLERTREIGLLRAIGLSRRRLRRMVTLESVAISVLGAVLGMVLGLIFGSLLRYALRSQMTSLDLPISRLLIFLVIAVVVGVLAAIVPGVRAARMRVLDAIATE